VRGWLKVISDQEARKKDNAEAQRTQREEGRKPQAHKPCLDCTRGHIVSRQPGNANVLIHVCFCTRLAGTFGLLRFRFSGWQRFS